VELTWDFLVRLLSITVIDLALSGDNAIVIGMAAAALPRTQRRWAILGGSGLAILLRATLTAIATLLMTITLLSTVGGVVLFWVAWRLLKIDTGEGQSETGPSAKNFHQAILLIVIADITMSTDNVIAVAGSANGSIVLLIAGLLISMPLLMVTGGSISMLIDRFKWLVYVGAGAICFTGARMIFEDAPIESRLGLHGVAILAISLTIGVVFPVAFYRVHHGLPRGIPERRDGP
jgi:YjbE family integral membrane protein